MTLLATGLATNQLLPLVRVGKIAPDGLLDWLGKPNYQVDVSSEPFNIIVNNSETCLSSIARDVDRLTRAGRETCASVIKETSGGNFKTPAWIAIKLYYAAFYYASGLLRLSATSLTYARTLDLLEFRKSLIAGGVSKLPKTGQYLLNVAANGGRLTFEKPTGGDGAHEATWKQLRLKIDDVRSRLSILPLPTNDRETLSKDLKALEEATSGLGSEPYLSSSRNDLQYRQSFASWNPALKANKTLKMKEAIDSIWKEDFDIRSDLLVPNSELGDFIASALRICGTSHAVIELLGSQGPGSFLTAGYSRYHRSLLKAAE